MLLKEVRVKNFRSILDETLACDSLTALVGRNGAGKSAFLSALELFYSPSPRVSIEDYYAQDTDREIEIEVTYGDLNSDAMKLFLPYLQDDSLKIVRVFSESQGRSPGIFYGTRLTNPEFDDVRKAGGRREQNNAYRELRSSEKYSDLPTTRTADEAEKAMQLWEKKNPDKCTLNRDDGQFFGFTQVARGYLGRFTNFLLIPAVRDARQDAIEGRGSPITHMMDLVVRNALTNRKELKDFREQTQAQYTSLVAPDKLTELTGLEVNLSETLQSYVPNSRVVLNWSELSTISFPNPEALVNLVEDGYQSTVERTGHGLQRAFIVTMLQHLASTRELDVTDQSDENADDANLVSIDRLIPNLVLAIEEPELYQHPSRQRHIAGVLLKLASGSITGVAKSTQVIYTTHSPLMVGLDRFDQIRVLRKTAYTDGDPKVTKVKKVNAQAVAEELWRADGATGDIYTARTLRARLQTIMTPWMNEGFFADTVVLVEGEDDRTALLGVASSMGVDFDGTGVCIIPCSGKDNIARPYAIFSQLDIPSYVVWDGDYGEGNGSPEGNISILRLLHQPEEDWPEFLRDECACFKKDLETTLEEEIGHDLFEELLADAQQTLGIRKRKQAIKNVSVIRYIIEKAADQGKSSKTVEGIVSKIGALNMRQDLLSPSDSRVRIQAI